MVDNISASTVEARFYVENGWGQIVLSDRGQEVADVAVDRDDYVYLLFRKPSAIVKCDPQGNPMLTIGEEVLSVRPHGITVRADGGILVVDEGAHCIRIFDQQGRQVGGFGSGPSNPDLAGVTSAAIATDAIARGYPPFTRPTRLAVAASGDLFVADGYGNARVHRFDPDGRLITSWGEPGTAPAEFCIPHDVLVDRQGRVLVSDRENDRIQLFTQDGAHLGMWTDLRRPQAVTQLPAGTFVVAEGSWRNNHVSPVLGPVPDADSRISVLDERGEVLHRIGGEEADSTTSFLAAHGIAADSTGAVYVAEVALSVGRAVGIAAAPTNCITKLVPVSV